MYSSRTHMMAFDLPYSAVPVKEEAQVHETALRVGHEDAAKATLPHRRWKTWKAGVAASATLCCAVLIINISLTVAAYLRFSGNMREGIGTLFQGSCDSVDSWSTGLHVIINVLSSAMLSASNYTMQSLAAPTRAEVNKAHAKGKSVDIGLLSYSNIMGRVSTWRTWAIWILALSSLPVHLLFNSSIFKTMDSNVYDIFLAEEGWLNGAPFNATDLPSYDGGYERLYTYNSSGRYYQYTDESAIQDYGPSYDYIRGKQDWFAQNRGNESMVQRLDNADCIARYGQHYLSGHGDVLLITSAPPEQDNRTFLWWGTIDHDRWRGGEWRFRRPTTMDWVFPGGNSDWIRAHPDRWSRNNRIVDYCLSRISTPKCELQFTIQVLIVVVVCNAIKTITMLSALLSHKDAPLVTIGDAIASFLKTSSGGVPPRLKSNIPTKKLRWRHTSPWRWLFTLPLCLGAIITASIYLHKGLTWTGIDNSTHTSLLSHGFGTLNPSSIIGSGPAQRGFKGLINCIILANLPQLICSILYLAYNGLFTSMLLGAEWSSYYLKHKPLRVSRLIGKQKSTCYLQLPFRYSIPLLVASTTLHWLISQSLFLSRIVVYREGVAIDLPGQEQSRVAFSCLPILLVIVLGSLMIIVAMCFGQRKLKMGSMPFVGSDSRRIEMACVAMRGDEGMEERLLAWGEVDVDIAQGQHLVPVYVDGVAHLETRKFCGFTSLIVREPSVM
ncbi:hypothetical protein HII31_06955 [Pseudocercospora fuligena]|uniref:DUF6536 domain-containing protein n=1 Tax=Pseudocercospora fuligena TaxID=685502 RepID=A0A8H6RID3_9PEZI|nr:hypothetical protein HII31_06955 [Pseudocercospora fuligena]